MGSLSASVDIAARTLGADAGDGLDEMVGRFLSLRGVASLMFEAFAFRSHRAADPILAAVALIHDLNRVVAESAHRPPTVFLRCAWRKRVKAVLLASIPEPMRSPSSCICVTACAPATSGSRAAAPGVSSSHLLPPATFSIMRAENPLGLCSRRRRHLLAARGAVLQAGLQGLATEAIAGRPTDATITDAGLSISPLRREQQDDARTLSGRLYTLMPCIRITDLLAEVNGWTNFADCFTHFGTG